MHMTISEIKFKGKNDNYSIFIGKNAINILTNKLRAVCPKTKKIALIVDKNIPKRFIRILKHKLQNYSLFTLSYTPSEKNKSLKTINLFLDKLISKNFNRSDLIIGIGGGITGDVAGFVASILKRGINFINIPTTLLSQVDSAVGGKTGVNSYQGKNMIGSFYQPRLVISDTAFLESLPKKEIVCGYAEILKHAVIKDEKFFMWLKKNSKFILEKKHNQLTYAIKKSCAIKISFVTKDVNEKGLRMILNFGHTFAHAIEVKSKYSKKISHGEAVLTGMILATKLSVFKKNCKLKTLNELRDLYFKNNLHYTLKNTSNPSWINSLIPILRHDKKNSDEKINFLLLKRIGKTVMPDKSKISIQNLKKNCKIIAQY